MKSRARATAKAKTPAGRQRYEGLGKGYSKGKDNGKGNGNGENAGETPAVRRQGHGNGECAMGARRER
jgi:hypothetical protein